MKLSKKKIFFGLVGFLTLGAFLFRFYHFERDLLFRLDQERDYQLIKKAFQYGPEHLPLLGPKAGAPVELSIDSPGQGNALNLGPIYYYFQYFSALLFGKVSPLALAFPDLVLSVLSIPLLYLLLRLAFSRSISFLTTLLWAWSLPLVEYSRFAWNTNQVLFWQLLLFYSLLQNLFFPDKRKKRLFFFLIFLSLGVLTQLHFIAFFVFPILIFLFWFFLKWPEENWKGWGIGVLILTFLYLPAIVSDLANRGENFRRLPATYFQEGEKTLEKESSWKKVEKVFSRFGQMSSHSVLSFNNNEIKKIEEYSGAAFLFGLVFFSFYLLRKIFIRRLSFFFQKKTFDVNQKDALRTLVFLSAMLLLVVYFKIFSRLHNFRYWLFFIPVFFWFWAEMLSFLEEKLRKKFFWPLALFLLIFPLVGHLTGLTDFYYGLEKGRGNSFFGRKLFLDDYQDLISLGMLNTAADRAIDVANEQGRKVCFWVESEQQKKSFKTVLREKYFKKYSLNELLEEKECVFILITELRKSGPVFPKKLKTYFKEKRRETIGSLVFWELEPLLDGERCAIIDYMEDSWKNSLSEAEKKSVVWALTWKDL